MSRKEHARQIQADRRLVWKGKKSKTSGGLTKAQLKKNSSGRIVSLKKSKAATKGYNAKNIGEKSAFRLCLEARNAVPKKGKFKKVSKGVCKYPSKKKPCRKDQLRNTKSKRCVKKSGKIGKAIIAKRKVKKQHGGLRLKTKKVSLDLSGVAGM